MTDNGSIRVNISMYPNEKETYEKVAKAENLTLSGLIRAAMKEYMKKPKGMVGASSAAGPDPLEDIIAGLDARITDIDAKLDEKFAEFTPKLDLSAEHEQKVKIIKAIIKNSKGIETGKIVECVPWDREAVTEVVLELQKLGSITKTGSKWSVV